jgi:DNA repair exonuclease SbcCD nuclease subunit
MPRPLRFLHLADCHLGARFGNLPPGVSEAKRARQRRNFGQLIDRAVDERVDMVLIAGDLFDRADPAPTDRQLVRQALGRLADAGIAVFIVPGNHDPVEGGGFWHEPLPGPGKIFTAPEFGSVVLDDLDVEVFGIGFDLATGHVNQLQRFASTPRASRSILVFHGGWLNFGGDFAKDHPFRTEDAAALPVNYLALGHYHQYTLVVDEPKRKAVYTGDLEGMDFSKGECGQRQAVLGEIDVDGAVTLTAVPVESLEMRRLDIDVSTLGVDGLRRAIDAVAATGVLLEVHLSGLPAVELIPEIERLEALYGEACAYFHVVDETVGLPALDGEGTQSYKHLYFDALKRRLDAADPAEVPKLRLALAIGLAAFEHKRK